MFKCSEPTGSAFSAEKFESVASEMRRSRGHALWRVLLVGAVALLLCTVAVVILHQTDAARAPPADRARPPDAASPARGALRSRTVMQAPLPAIIAVVDKAAPAESTIVTVPRASFSIAVHAHLDKVSDFIRTRGSWEPELLASIAREFPPTSDGAKARLFVDIGANIGWFSLNVAARGHRVVSVEPFPRNLALLSFSAARLTRERGPLRTGAAVHAANGNITVVDVPRVRLMPLAVGAGGEPEMCIFHQGAQNRGNGRLVPAFDGVRSFVDAANVHCEARVRVARLDALLDAEFARTGGEQRIWGLKIDVEGFEAMALRGLDSYFRQPQRRPCHIWFEFARDWVVATGATATEIFELLDATGYTLHKETMSDSNVEAHSTDPQCAYVLRAGLAAWRAFTQDRITWRPRQPGWPGPGLAAWRQRPSNTRM